MASRTSPAPRAAPLGPVCLGPCGAFSPIWARSFPYNFPRSLIDDQRACRVVCGWRPTSGKEVMGNGSPNTIWAAVPLAVVQDRHQKRGEMGQREGLSGARRPQTARGGVRGRPRRQGIRGLAVSPRLPRGRSLAPPDVVVLFPRAYSPAQLEAIRVLSGTFVLLSSFGPGAIILPCP